ncbi:MAG: flavodoxin family protein [Fibrobacter sp.]|nr:flavodoxin family protein [Fibrobacter sp.]
MVKWIIAYSSATGNTRRLAEAAAKKIGADIINVQDLIGTANIRDNDDDEVSISIGHNSLAVSTEVLEKNISKKLAPYDGVMVGYWLRRGAPDKKASILLSRITGKKVALFQTHGAYEGTEHAITAFARAGSLLGAGNKILGTFSCQGAVNPMLIKKRLEGSVPGHRGENLEECKKRWADAASKPNENDLKRMEDFAARMDAIAERESKSYI